MVDKSTDGQKPAAPPPAGGDVRYGLDEASNPAMLLAREAARQLYDAGASYEQTEMQMLLRKQAEAQLRSAKAAILNDIEAAIALAPDGTTKKELQELKERVGGARSVGELTSLRSEVTAAVTAAASAAAAKGDDKVVDFDKALERIEQLNKQIDDNFYKLDNHLKPEEKKKLEELKEEIEKRKEELDRLRRLGATPEQVMAAEQAWLDAQNKRNSYEDTVTKRLQSDTSIPPEDKIIVDDTADKIKKQREELTAAQKLLLEKKEKLWRAEEEKNEITKNQIAINREALVNQLQEMQSIRDPKELALALESLKEDIKKASATSVQSKEQAENYLDSAIKVSSNLSVNLEEASATDHKKSNVPQVAKADNASSLGV